MVNVYNIKLTDEELLILGKALLTAIDSWEATIKKYGGTNQNFVNVFQDNIDKTNKLYKDVLERRVKIED